MKNWGITFFASTLLFFSGCMESNTGSVSKTPSSTVISPGAGTGSGGSPSPSPSPTPTPATYSNFTIGSFSVQVELATGNISSITHPSFGEILRAPVSMSRIISLSYPTIEFVGLQLQPSSSFSPTITNLAPAGVKIQWSKFESTRQEGAVKTVNVEVEIEISPSVAAIDGATGGIALKATVKNNSAIQISQVQFPDLAGFRSFGYNYGAIQFQKPLKIITAYDYSFPLIATESETERTSFYAASDWKRFPLNESADVDLVTDSGIQFKIPRATVANHWMYFENCAGKRLYIKQTAQIDAPVAAEMMARRDLTDATALRVLWRNQARVDPSGTWHSPRFAILPSISDPTVCL